MSSIGERFAKRKAQYKARGGTKTKSARVGLANRMVRQAMTRRAAGVGELKFIDLSNTMTTNIGGSGFSALNLLNGVAPGTDATTRIGRKIRIKSLLIRWKANLQPTSVGGSPIRLMCVYDKQTNGAAPTAATILLADAFLSPNNLDNRDRFVTLFDIITDPLSVAGDVEIGGTLFKKLDLETMFNSGTAGTVADITTGSIYLMAAQAGSVTTAAPTVVFRSRVRFEDA